ncbi:MAG: DUF1003 domain-containing protein [Pyrinomonadaceae bacterium]|nr:DUF1003 domain-containing protein [Pyrinomonadaceae bacterium]
MATNSRKRRSPAAKSGIADETESNIVEIINIDQKQKDERSRGEKISVAITRFSGSMAFVMLNTAWFVGWIVLNVLLGDTAFDPYPFTFLTFVVSLEAIFLSTFILVTQNHEALVTERRNHLDLQVNLLAERENTKILELLQQMAAKLDIKVKGKNLDAMLHDVKPAKLVEQIRDAAENINGK